MEPLHRESEAWVWYGGHVAVDFVNTRRDREADGAEYLQDPDDLARWLVAAGLVAARAPLALDEGVLAAARELRESVDAGIQATIAGSPFPDTAAAVLNRWLAHESTAALCLEIRDGVATLSRATEQPPANAALQRIAVAAAQLLGTDERAGLRICPGPRCGGRFLDASPARRRRWCSMAVCGNRAKAAKHRGGGTGS